MSAEMTIDELLPPLLPTAYRLAYRLCGNAADAEDIVQDAALNACRGFAGFAPGTNARAWFLRIVLNVFRSRYRRTRRVRMLSVEELELPEIGRGEAWARFSSEEDPATRLVGEIDSERVMEALDRLPPEYRIVATLYFVDDLPYAEIASIVGCPIGTVRSRLHRGRQVLMRELESFVADRAA